jgi:propanediol dehydratase small subunit
MIKIIIIFIILVSVVFFELKRRKRLNKYWYRADFISAKKWKGIFPESSNDEIRAFLETFVDGFAFSSKKRLKFEPNDKISSIYNDLYPDKGWPDALELETFSLNLEKKYHLKLSEIWNEDLTLGEIFRKIIKK